MCPEQIRIGSSRSDCRITTVVERSGGQDENRTVDSNSEAEQRQRRVHLQNRTFFQPIRSKRHADSATHGRMRDRHGNKLDPIKRLDFGLIPCLFPLPLGVGLFLLLGRFDLFHLFL